MGMNLDNIISEKSVHIMWGLHIAIFLWLLGDGAIVGYTINKYFICAILAASLVVYTKMHNALLVEQSTRQEQEGKLISIMNTQEKKEEPHTKEMPFDFKTI